MNNAEKKVNMDRRVPEGRQWVPPPLSSGRKTLQTTWDDREESTDVTDSGTTMDSAVVLSVQNEKQKGEAEREAEDLHADEVQWGCNLTAFQVFCWDPAQEKMISLEKRFAHYIEIAVAILSVIDHFTDLWVLFQPEEGFIYDDRVSVWIVVLSLLSISTTTILPAIAASELWLKFMMFVGLGMMGLIWQLGDTKTREELVHLNERQYVISHAVIFKTRHFQRLKEDMKELKQHFEHRKNHGVSANDKEQQALERKLANFDKGGFYLRFEKLLNQWRDDLTAKHSNENERDELWEVLAIADKFMREHPRSGLTDVGDCYEFLTMFEDRLATHKSEIISELFTAYKPKLYKVCEAATESLPQMLLQLYVAIELRITWEKNWILYASLFVSFMSHVYAGTKLVLPKGFTHNTICFLYTVSDISARALTLLYFIAATTVVDVETSFRFWILLAYVLTSLALNWCLTYYNEAYANNTTFFFVIAPMCMTLVLPLSSTTAFFIATAGMDMSHEQIGRYFKVDVLFRYAWMGFFLYYPERTEHDILFRSAAAAMIVYAIVILAHPRGLHVNLEQVPRKNLIEVVALRIEDFAGEGILGVSVVCFMAGTLLGMIALSVLTFMHVEQLQLQLMWTGFPMLCVATFLLSMKSGFNGKILVNPRLPMLIEDRNRARLEEREPWADHFMSGISGLGVWMPFMTFVCLVVYLLEYGSDDATSEIAEAWLILYGCVFALSGLLFALAEEMDAGQTFLFIFGSFLLFAWTSGQIALGGLLLLRFDMSVSLVHCLALLPGLLFSVFTLACAFWFLNGLSRRCFGTTPRYYDDVILPYLFLGLFALFFSIQMITIWVYAAQDHWSVEQNFVALGFLFWDLAVLVPSCCGCCCYVGYQFTTP